MRGRMCVVLICNVCVRVGVQVEYSAINLAYAYATTSGVMRKAAILRHAAGRADRGMECAGGEASQRKIGPSAIPWYLMSFLVE